MNTLFRITDELAFERTNLSFADNVENILGQIIMNRVAGIAYDKIELKNLHSEAKKALKQNKDVNVALNLLFERNLCYMSKILGSADFQYALLKGAYLTPFLYEIGHRTSNDIDILVADENVSKVQKLLLNNGFVQGHLSAQGDIVLATRKEIIDSKMNNGETVPFLKQIDGEVLEVDVNFSLDFKPMQDNRIVSEMLSVAVDVEKGDLHFKTLRFDDFLIHLCCHLYKEAATLDWVTTRRDLMLYKFSDINVFAHRNGNAQYFDSLVKRIQYFGLEKECYYTFENSSIIYPNLNKIEGFLAAKETIKPSDLRFMARIVYPREKRLFQHHMSFTDWFFCPDRIARLEEIPYEAT
jgi:hypothetical protein